MDRRISIMYDVALVSSVRLVPEEPDADASLLFPGSYSAF